MVCARGGLDPGSYCSCDPDTFMSWEKASSDRSQVTRGKVSGEEFAPIPAGPPTSACHQTSFGHRPDSNQLGCLMPSDVILRLSPNTRRGH